MRSLAITAACLAVTVSTGATLHAAETDSGGSPLSARNLESAWRESRHGHYTNAIAIAGKAIAATPDFAEAYVIRADFYKQAGRYEEALADLDRAAAMHPEAASLVLARAEIAVRRQDPDTALALVARASSLPINTVWKRRYETVSTYTASRAYALQSIALELKHDADGALAGFGNMLKYETIRPWYILNFHCYAAAVAGLPEMAELSCDEAIRLESHDRGAYDSRGFAHLKMHEWVKAIADYNAMLTDRPDLTLALYGRGVAKIGLGDMAGGNADIAAAAAGEPDIVNIMARLGLKR